MDTQQFVSPRASETTTFGKLLPRYRETVSPRKRGATEEGFRLRALCRRKMARLAVINVTPQVIADFRDERPRECCPGTMTRDLAVLSSIFNHARRQWNVALSNPVEMVPSRSRRRDGGC